MFKSLTKIVGRRLARHLNQPVRHYEPFAISDLPKLAAVLRPGDVLLVEGNRRISTAIKYLTQSTWSHAALYVGDALGQGCDPRSSPVLVEADLEHGVVAVPLAKYADLNTRICRPSGLSEQDLGQVIGYVIARRGQRYDLRHVIDLARYLLPIPPVPVYWRRRMLALGSGDPTRAICSTLIAQAFQLVRYPILPRIERRAVADDGHLGYTIKEMLHIRHYSLFTPRDFDISPYFDVVKAAVAAGFDYRTLNWVDPPGGPDATPSGGGN